MTFLEKIAQEAGAEAAQAIVEEAAQEAVAEASAAADEAGIDASPEELAQAAAAVIDEKVEEKAAEYVEKMAKSQLHDKEASFLVKKAAFEAEVTKIARHILATNGFDPDTGGRIPRMSLARTPEEVKYAAALESLETAGWPVQWDPTFLARAAEEG